MKTLRLLLGALAFLGFASTILNAQQSQLLYRKDGPASGAVMGTSVGGGKDVDGDGYDDFIIGAPGRDSAFVYSGINGNLLFRKGGQANSEFGKSVALIGDRNSDGRSEFIVGAPFYDDIGLNRDGAVFVYDGATGNLVAGLDKYGADPLNDLDQFGFAVNSAGDVNSDGKADYIVGNPGFGAGNNGRVLVYSGADGSAFTYLTKVGVSGDHLGYSVASAGDLSNPADGKADVIVGAPYADNGGSSDVGAAFVYSGANGNLIFSKYGANQTDHLGWSVDGGANIAGDSKPDFIVGAPHEFPPGIGAAYVYSGADASLLYSKTGAQSGDGFGSSVAIAGQIDQEGGEDFIIGAPYFDLPGKNNCGKVFLYSGSSSSLIWNYAGSFADDKFGWSVNKGGQSLYCPDLCESVDNFIIGAPHTDFNGSNSGSGFVWRIVYPPLPKVGIGNVPTAFELRQNYPNPFNANTNISFSLNAESKVELAVYNILGEKVRTLISKDRAAGVHEVAFDGKDDKGRSLSSGTYFYKLTAGNRVVTKQMVLIK